MRRDFKCKNIFVPNRVIPNLIAVFYLFIDDELDVENS
jgi:hypothetical protein